MPPLWLVALIVAAAAPFCATALQVVLESRLRRRTNAVLTRARATLDEEVEQENPGERSCE
jgi:hypothetical protein